MANPEHLSLLTRSVADWNKWRKDNRDIQPDLSGADLSRAILNDDLSKGVDLRNANLTQANLSKAWLPWSNLAYADLQGANLSDTNLIHTTFDHATLVGADLRRADLTQSKLTSVDFAGAKLTAARLDRADMSFSFLIGADLAFANLGGANLTGAVLIRAKLERSSLVGATLVKARLSEANLSRANLTEAVLVRADLENADLTSCNIYGISAWDVRLENAKQTNLIITPSEEPDITVDKLEVAQFIYLLLNNPRIREVIDTITSKVVLILGRFTPERKVVLDAIREKLRTKNYSPVVFDFEKPISRDLTETVMTLAGMAKFVIADLTDPKSLPHELMSFVEKLPSVPVLPLLLASQKQEYAMFEHLQRYPWVMETVFYKNQKALLRSLESTVILPAERKAKKLIATQRR